MDDQNDYVESLSAQMVEWDAQIYRLKVKAGSAPTETNHEYAAAIAVLQRKRDEAAIKLQGISTVSVDEWKDLKAGTDRVWSEVSALVHDTIVKIK